MTMLVKRSTRESVRSLFRLLNGVDSPQSAPPHLRHFIVHTITKEVDITGHSVFLSLDEAPGVWADKVLAYVEFERKSNKKELLEAGYDIQQTADTVSKLYLEVSQKL